MNRGKVSRGLAPVRPLAASLEKPGPSPGPPALQIILTISKHLCKLMAESREGGAIALE